jgi:protein subunit release factor B
MIGGKYHVSTDIVKQKVNKTRRKITPAITTTSSSILQAREQIKKGREQLDSLERTLNELEREKLRAAQNERTT